MTDNEGKTDTITQSVIVDNASPDAHFSSSAAGQNITFTDQSTDPDGTIAAWSWSFGDGDSATAQNPTHSYAAATGTYSVELTVTDNDGKTDTITQNVTMCPDVDECTDTDGDGVPDEWDECEDTPANIPVNSKGCPAKPKIVVIPL